MAAPRFLSADQLMSKIQARAAGPYSAEHSQRVVLQASTSNFLSALGHPTQPGG